MFDKVSKQKVDALSGHGHFWIHISYSCCTHSATIPDEYFIVVLFIAPLYILQSSNRIYYLLYSYYFKRLSYDDDEFYIE